jgi:hypothetical protein
MRSLRRGSKTWLSKIEQDMTRKFKHSKIKLLRMFKLSLEKLKRERNLSYWLLVKLSLRGLTLLPSFFSVKKKEIRLRPLDSK